MMTLEEVRVVAIMLVLLSAAYSYNYNVNKWKIVVNAIITYLLRQELGVRCREAESNGKSFKSRQ